MISHLKRLVRLQSSSHLHSADVARLISVSKDRDCELSEEDAVYVWEKYSDTYAAGWLIMENYSDDDLFHVIRTYMKIEGEPEDA